VPRVIVGLAALAGLLVVPWPGVAFVFVVPSLAMLPGLALATIEPAAIGVARVTAGIGALWMALATFLVLAHGGWAYALVTGVHTAILLAALRERRLGPLATGIGLLHVLAGMIALALGIDAVAFTVASTALAVTGASLRPPAVELPTAIVHKGELA
jgi:hypothetical protein